MHSLKGKEEPFFELAYDEPSFSARFSLHQQQMYRKDWVSLSSSCRRIGSTLYMMITDILCIFQPVSDYSFWVAYLRRSSFFSIFIAFLNCLALCTFFAIGIRAEFMAGNPINIPFYRGSLTFQILYWIIVNVGIIITSIVVNYLPSSFRSLSGNELLDLWISYGYFILFSRILLLGMSLTSYNAFVLKSAAVEGSGVPVGYSLCILLLNTIQTIAVSTQPFPWSWANILSGIQLLEYMVTLLATRSQIFDVLPLYCQVELLIYFITGHIMVSYMAADFEAINMHSFKTNLNNKLAVERKHRLVEMLCSDIKLPLQYLITAMVALPSAGDAKSDGPATDIIHRISRNLNAMSYLVDGVLVLARIDDERFKVCIDEIVDLPLLLKKVAASSESANRMRWADLMHFDLEVGHILRSDSNCLQIILNSILEYSRMLVSAMTEVAEGGGAVGRQVLLLRAVLGVDELCISLESAEEGISLPVAANGLHLILCRASIALLGGKMLVGARGSLHLSIPCVVVKDRRVASVSLHGTRPQVPEPQQRQKQSADADVDGDRDASSRNAPYGDLDRPLDAKKICVLATDDGLETCVTSILERLEQVQFEILHLRELSIGKGDEVMPLLDSSSGVKTGDAELMRCDAVFVSTLSLCKSLRSRGYVGKTVLFSTGLSYLDIKSAGWCCDGTLAIPCSDVEVTSLLAALWTASPRIALESSSASSSSPDSDSDQQSRGQPQTLTRTIHDLVEVLPHNHTLFRWLSLVGRAFGVHHRRASGGDASALTSLIRRVGSVLDDLRFAVLGDFISYGDSNMDGSILSRRYNFIPRTCLGMRMFETRVEKNFALWRLNNYLIFDADYWWHNVAVYSQFLSRVYELYCHTGNFWFLLNNASIWFYYCHVFRSVWNKYLWMPLGYGVHYLLWRWGGIIAGTIFVSIGTKARLQIISQYNEGLFNSLGEFLAGTYDGLTGDQVLIALVVFLVLMNSHWVSYFPWPSGMYFIWGILIRHMILADVMFKIFGGSTNDYVFMAALFGHHFFILMVILFRDETFHRESFQAYCKSRHSTVFMHRVLRAFMDDLDAPLSQLLEDKQGLISLLSAQLQRGNLYISKSVQKQWNSLCYGYSTLDSLHSQFRYHTMFEDLQSGKDGSSMVVSDGPAMLFSRTKLEMLVAQIAAPYSHLALSGLCDIQIFYSISHHLAVVKTDANLLKTLLSNALQIAVRNIQRGLQRHPKSIAYVQQICIIVAEHPSFAVSGGAGDALGLSGGGGAGAGGRGAADARDGADRCPAPRLKFFDPRLMVVEILDCGVLPTNPGRDSGSGVGSGSNFGAGFDICRNIVMRFAQSLSPGLLAASFYDMSSIYSPSSQYSCMQRFTMPFKLDNLSAFYRADSRHEQFMRRRKCVTKVSDFLLDECQKQLLQRDMLGGYHVPLMASHGGEISPLMILVYEQRPDQTLGPSSPYFVCPAVFKRRRWRYEVVNDVCSPEFLTRMHAATCVVVDNSAVLSDAASPEDDPGSLGRRIRLMGFSMILIGMFPKSTKGSARLPSRLAIGKARRNVDYDIVLHEPITEEGMGEVVSLCDSNRLPILMHLHFDDV